MPSWWRYHENGMGIRAKSRHMAMSGASTDYIGFRYALDEIINEET